ncbi:hypothetical protein E2C01_098652 [Portunus trituberculatus]|uniref:Uncharacterized protein n=1 Tax=Portunus trituberculatus TaxID=210409 RepID=A0A5B7K8Y3_PORTR|nr:hypothetical protein [Portunus trituberculatus]
MAGPGAGRGCGGLGVVHRGYTHSLVPQLHLNKGNGMSGYAGHDGTRTTHRRN